MAQLVKCLVYKLENLSSDPQDPCESHGMVACSCTPTAGVTETGDVGLWPTHIHTQTDGRGGDPITQTTKVF